MNRIVVFILFILSIQAKDIYRNDKLIRIQPSTFEHIEYLQTLERTSTIDFWTDILGINRTIDVHLNENHFENYRLQFEKHSLSYKILIENLQELIDHEHEQIVFDHLKRRWYGGNSLNIVGTYASYNQMMDYIQEKANLYPNSIKIIDFGWTFENRLLKGISLQFNPFTKRNIWIDCGIHAREWITQATCIWMIEKFLEDYRNNDPIVRDLLQFWNVYIVPSLNPDGYEYSRTTGNRLWRKNRSITPNSPCIGVDLNRNYPWQWMTGGSSNDPCSEIFAGQSAGSEIETKNIVQFLQTNNQTWDMYMSFHSYGQWWFTPYGYTTNLPVDYTKLFTLAKQGADAIETVNNRKYELGSVAQLLYIASGSTIDWAYDVLKIPYTYTIELPPADDFYGFLLPPDQAPGICNETYIGMKVFLTGVKKELVTTMNG